MLLPYRSETNILVEEMRSESRNTHQSRSTGETEAVTEIGTEITQTEGKIPVKGLEVEATSERGMLRTYVSSKQRESFITREGESTGKTTKGAALTRIQNSGSLITNQKTKLR